MAIWRPSCWRARSARLRTALISMPAHLSHRPGARRQDEANRRPWRRRGGFIVMAARLGHPASMPASTSLHTARYGQEMSVARKRWTLAYAGNNLDWPISICHAAASRERRYQPTGEGDGDGGRGGSRADCAISEAASRHGPMKAQMRVCRRRKPR